MSLSIGRAGREGGRIEPTDITIEGDRMSIDGNLTVDLTVETVGDLRAARDQLVGYDDNPNERFTVLDWPEEPDLEGLWQVLSIEADMDDDALETGAVEFSADFVAVPAQPPTTEIITVHGFRAHDHDGFLWNHATGGAIQGVPAETRQFLSAAAAASIPAGGIQRWVDDGPGGIGRVRLEVLQDGWVGDPSPFPAHKIVTSMVIPPHAWYRGGCRVTYLDRDGVRRNLVGVRLPAGIDPATVRVDNGCFRAGVTAYDGVSTIETSVLTRAGDDAPLVWDPIEWLLSRMVDVGGAAYVAGFAGLVQSVAVIRNGPEQATVRWSFNLAAGTELVEVANRSTLDVTLRRGQMIAECTWRIRRSFDPELRVDPIANAVLGSDIVGGRVADESHSGLSRWVALSPQELEPDAGSSLGIALAADDADRFTFGLGHAIEPAAYSFDQGPIGIDAETLPGPDPVNGTTGLDLRSQYFWVQAAQQTVVGT